MGWGWGAAQWYNICPMFWRNERPVGNLNSCERAAGWSLGHRREGHSRNSYLVSRINILAG